MFVPESAFVPISQLEEVTQLSCKRFAYKPTPQATHCLLVLELPTFPLPHAVAGLTQME